MVDKTKRDPQPAAEAEPATTESTRKSPRQLLACIANPRWLSIVLAAFLLGQCATVVFSGRSKPAPPAPPPSREIPLGEFRFVAKPDRAGSITQAEFSLYVVPPDPIAQEALPRLNAHKYRLRQDIEELLRRAHSGDFEDPTLAELKRQLQERINATLGMRAVSEVIIVDLSLARAPLTESPRQAAAAPPPIQPPSGS